MQLAGFMKVLRSSSARTSHFNLPKVLLFASRILAGFPSKLCGTERLSRIDVVAERQ